MADHGVVALLFTDLVGSAELLTRLGGYPGRSVELRLTRSALADLGLDAPALAGRPAGELVDRHPIIAAFVERRSQNPEGQEAIQLPESRAIVYSLHAGRLEGSDLVGARPRARLAAWSRLPPERRPQ